jgi:hypothetical protein
MFNYYLSGSVIKILSGEKLRKEFNLNNPRCSLRNRGLGTK